MRLQVDSERLPTVERKVAARFAVGCGAMSRSDLHTMAAVHGDFRRL
jgi:hypothetical protein